MKKSGPPKLPDFSASSIGSPSSDAVHGTPGAISGPMASARTPSASVTAPEVSPPATTKRRTPAAAIVVTAAMAIALVVAAAIAKALVFDADTSAYSWKLAREFVESLKQGTIFDLATNCVIFSASVFYTLAALGLIVLRTRRPDLPRTYHTPGYPLVPFVFIAVYAWFLVQIFIDKPLESGFGLVIILLGVPAYFAYQRWKRP